MVRFLHTLVPERFHRKSIVAIEAQAFSLQEPSYFFSIYSPPRTEAGYKPARARLEEDLRFASRMVGFAFSRQFYNMLILYEDYKPLYRPQRISIRPISYARSSPSTRTFEACHPESTTAAT